MNQPLELLQDGVALVVFATAPIALAALVGALLTSLLGLVSGLQDPVIGLVMRALAVVLAVAALFAVVVEKLQTLATSALAGIGAAQGIGPS